MGRRRRCGPDRATDREDELSECVGSFVLISGLEGLKPSRLIPSKSISQVSSLLGELQDALAGIVRLTGRHCNTHVSRAR
jgi:hypothetical protein